MEIEETLVMKRNLLALGLYFPDQAGAGGTEIEIDGERGRFGPIH
jgi:hypothetical protein